MNLLKNTTVLAALMLLVSANAYATHPLITDDTGTQGKGKYQIEINSRFSRDSENGIETRSKEASSTLSCGITDNIDLIAGLPLEWRTLSSTKEQGIGDMGVDVKWRLLRSEVHNLSVALKPGFSIPTGNAEKGFGHGEPCTKAMLIATHKGRLGALHCNIGYTRNAYKLDSDKETLRQNIWNGSLAAEINVLTNIKTVADIGIETNQDKASDSHPAFLLGGVIYSVSENLDLDLGLKEGLNKSATDRSLLVGMSARF